MPRLTKLTNDVRREVLAAIRAGNDNVVAAGAQGVSEATFYRWMSRGAPDASCPSEKDGREGCDGGEHAPGTCPANEPFRAFRESVERARCECEVRMSGYIAKKAPRSTADAKYILERRFPGRWKQTQRVETGARSDEAPFEIILIPSDRPQEELDELAGLGVTSGPARPSAGSKG